MRRLLACLFVSSWLLGCGQDNAGLFEPPSGAGNAGAAGTSEVDAGQQAGGGFGHTGGAGGAGGLIAPDASVGSEPSPDVGGTGEGGGAGGGEDAVGSDASDVSLAPSDARDGGGEGSDASSSDAPYCTGPLDCATPTNVCLAATCVDYACGTKPVAQGWPIPTQTAGDCKRVECDGTGLTRSVNDDSDAPSDGNTCTTDGCSGGSPTHTPVTIGTPCSAGFCDATGKCVQCLAPSDCGSATACSSPSCDNGTCGVVYAAVDKPIPTQTTGDCKVTVCDGAGSTKQNIDDNDKPDDSNVCTDDTCNGGTMGHTVLTGHSCGVSGVCNDQGICVGCNAPTDCGGADDFCKARTCDNNVCGFSFTAADTKLPDNQQTAKDCKKKICDGSGAIQTVPDGTDLPVDGNECTLDQCSGSTPQNPYANPGTTCSTGICDGAGSCVECLSPANCPATGSACINATCGIDHRCATEYVTPDTSCGTGPSCMSGQSHAQDKCNSTGVCVSGSDVACSPYICDTSACKVSCSGDGDCAAGYTCDTGLSVCTNGPKCTDYCSAIMSACTGSNAQYFSQAACLQSCAALPRGTPADGSGNTVGCRITHAGLAVGDPGTHCPHAGPGGAGVCSASNCDGFCTIALATCKGPNQVWATAAACLTDCATFPTVPAYNASISSGDSWACRMWHLTAAAGIDPATHCPHIQVVSATCH